MGGVLSWDGSSPGSEVALSPLTGRGLLAENRSPHPITVACQNQGEGVYCSDGRTRILGS